MSQVFEELSPVLQVLELFGLQSFSLKSLTVKNLKKNPSLGRFMYLVLWLIALPTITVFRVLGDDSVGSQSPVTPRSILMFVIIHSMNLGSMLVVFCSLFQSFACTQKVKKIFLNTRNIIQICQDEFKIVIDAKKIKVNALKRLITAVVVTSSLHATVILIQFETVADLFDMTLGLVPIMFLVLVVYKFVFFVCMVNNQLEFIKALLEKMFKQELIKIIDNINFHLTAVKPATADGPLRKLRVITKVYATIYENGNLINESNGLTVLVLLMSLVIALTVAGYESFVIVIGGLPTEQIPGES